MEWWLLGASCSGSELETSIDLDAAVAALQPARLPVIFYKPISVKAFNILWAVVCKRGLFISRLAYTGWRLA